MEKIKETTRWIIYYSDELQGKIAHDKQTGVRTTEETKDEPRVRYTSREFRIIGQPDKNINLFKIVFDGIIVDG